MAAFPDQLHHILYSPRGKAAAVKQTCLVRGCCLDTRLILRRKKQDAYCVTQAICYFVAAAASDRARFALMVV